MPSCDQLLAKMSSRSCIQDNNVYYCVKLINEIKTNTPHAACYPNSTHSALACGQENHLCFDMSLLEKVNSFLYEREIWERHTRTSSQITVISILTAATSKGFANPTLSTSPLLQVGPPSVFLLRIAPITMTIFLIRS